MEKKIKQLSIIICLILFAFAAMGCDSSSNSATNSSPDSSKEEQDVEIKSEYHVGDSVNDGNLKIVYVASGEYSESNEFLQPAEGNKLVFFKFTFENQGNSDEFVSSLNFEGYADGYSAEMHYNDNDEEISATLSSGRSTEGMIIIEVPKDSSDIEVEYETNIFSEEKIKFIYDGAKDSGYSVKENTAASDNAYSVGDSLESDGISITYLSCENDKSYNSFFAPKSGYHYITLSFEFENKSDNDQYISIFDFSCYSDGTNCEMAYFRDDQLNANLSSGRKTQGTVSFSVPDNASTVEAEYLSDFWTSKRVVFSINN